VDEQATDRARPGTCCHHPSRAAVDQLGSRSYCSICRDGRLRAAALAVRARPTQCFVAYLGGENWTVFHHGAQAHWLAHELCIMAPPGHPVCAAGLAVKREDLVRARREVLQGRPRPGDLWIDLGPDDCGVVTTVRIDPERGLAISIRHLRSEGGKDFTDDFYDYFKGRGLFFR
jgi:hypothetical protein